MPNEPSPLTAAFIRAIYGAILTAAVTFFPLLSTDLSYRQMFAAVGTAFVGYIAARGGVEGWYDQKVKPLQNQPPASNLDGSQPAIDFNNPGKEV